MWFLLSCIAAGSNAGHSIAIKLLPRYSGLEVACITHILSGIIAFSLIFIFALEIPLDLEFLIPAFATIILNTVATILLYTAIIRSEISVSLPFLSITPALAAIIAYFARGEVLSALTIMGIFMIIAGTFTIDSTSIRDLIRFGGLRIFKDRGVQLVCIVAFIFSFSSVYDKDAMLASDPLTFSTVSFAARGVLFACLLILLTRQNVNLAPKSFRETTILVIMAGLFFAELLSQINALQFIEVAPVVAVKRLSLILTTVAGFLLFKEAYSHGRLSGAFIMIFGSIIIYFG